jgi:hypothetical protein
MMRSASPLEGNTTDWRAGCGRSASPVRREGEAVPLSTPIVAQLLLAGVAGTSPAMTMGATITPVGALIRA